MLFRSPAFPRNPRGRLGFPGPTQGKAEIPVVTREFRRNSRNPTWFPPLGKMKPLPYLFVTTWTAAYQASLSFTISRSLLKLMPNELVMPSNHLVLCHSILLLPSIFPDIRVFSNELTLHIKWPKYWSFSFLISLPMHIQG